MSLAGFNTIQRDLLIIL